MTMTYTLTPAARRVALHTLRTLRARDAEYWEYRAAQYALPTRERDWGWQDYCIHGSYIGDPYGGDYLCGLCESGVTIYDEALAQAHAADRAWEAIIDLIPSLHKAERLGGIESSDAALNRMIDSWIARYLPGQD